jgi:rhamnose utilization protein RhaD (predicted bifunctional aldolase and dehydrogenase)
MDDFIKLCRACSLDELAQASGGNISVKDKNILYIKASGISLSDVTAYSGYAIVDNKKVLNSMQHDTEPDIMSFLISGNERPSLEIYFHSFLKNYVIHLHPTCMNGFLCSERPELIDYKKPGFILSKSILKYYNSQSILYLKNHGVIFHADTADEVLSLISSELNKFKKIWSTDLQDFWNIQNKYSSDFIYRVPYCESIRWISIVEMPIAPFTPDMILFLTDSIILNNNSVYIRGSTKQKCIAILEVLRSYCYTYDDTLTILNNEEVYEILNWDVEKYRKLKP